MAVNDNMAIKINEAAFSSGMTNLSTAFQSISDKIKEINRETAKLSLFWSSAEATKFSTDMSEIEGNLAKFETKYGNYITLLDTALSSYMTDNSNIIESINKIANGYTPPDTGGSDGESTS